MSPATQEVNFRQDAQQVLNDALRGSGRYRNLMSCFCVCSNSYLYSISSLAARPWTAPPRPWQVEGEEACHACSSVVALLVRAGWGKAVFSWSLGQDGLG